MFLSDDSYILKIHTTVFMDEMIKSLEFASK